MGQQQGDGFLARWARRKSRSRSSGGDGEAGTGSKGTASGKAPVANPTPHAPTRGPTSEAPPGDDDGAGTGAARAGAEPLGSGSADPGAREGAGRDPGSSAGGERGPSPDPSGDRERPRALSGSPEGGEGAPELPPLESLGPESDYAPFMSRRVAKSVRRAALRRLFSDPRLNVVDGLDDYDEDFRSFASLGSIVTSDMRFEAARRRLLEETRLAEQGKGRTWTGEGAAHTDPEPGMTTDGGTGEGARAGGRPAGTPPDPDVAQGEPRVRPEVAPGAGEAASPPPSGGHGARGQARDRGHPVGNRAARGQADRGEIADGDEAPEAGLRPSTDPPGAREEEA